MADWDETKPLNTDIVSQYPANERAARAAVKTNFGIDHEETVGADVGKHQSVQLLKQTTPTSVADQGFVYSKDVGSGVIELHYTDHDDNETQLTKGGKILNPVVESRILFTGGQTTATFNPVPGNVRRIVMELKAVNISGTDTMIVQLRHATNWQITGYTGGSVRLAVAGINGGARTDGFAINSNDADFFHSGHMILTNITDDGRDWVASYTGKASASPLVMIHSAGDIALPSAFTGIRLKLVGSDTFDAGSVNIQYE